MGGFIRRNHRRKKQRSERFVFVQGRRWVHYSNQQLTELIAGKKFVWLVTESNLSFLKNTNEWAETKICFDIEQENDKTKVTFTQEGLVPKLNAIMDAPVVQTMYIFKM